MNNVQAFRLEKGWNLRQLGERAGLSASTILRIERGNIRPSIESYSKLARALGVSIEALAGPLDNAIKADEQTAAREVEKALGDVAFAVDRLQSAWRDYWAARASQ